jgi:hypothetical protein
MLPSPLEPFYFLQNVGLLHRALSITFGQNTKKLVEEFTSVMQFHLLPSFVKFLEQVLIALAS